VMVISGTKMALHPGGESPSGVMMPATTGNTVAA
jgi:hypothetical protein